MRVLDLRCGGGAQPLWLCERLPRVLVIAVTSSRHEREWIQAARARDRGAQASASSSMPSVSVVDELVTPSVTARWLGTRRIVAVLFGVDARLGLHARPDWTGRPEVGIAPRRDSTGDCWRAADASSSTLYRLARLGERRRLHNRQSPSQRLSGVRRSSRRDRWPPR
jgi:hypothetical protein